MQHRTHAHAHGSETNTAHTPMRYIGHSMVTSDYTWTPQLTTRKHTPTRPTKHADTYTPTNNPTRNSKISARIQSSHTEKY